MGFETKVLAVVEDVLETRHKAGFEYGTLFVLCSSTEANVILDALREKFMILDIIPSEMPNGNEWAFDFA